jgi:hypothetical protein
MRCPACNAENPNDVRKCASCGEAFSPRQRRRAAVDDGNGASNSNADMHNAAALRAYRLSLYAMIPGAGLLLGPIALILAIVAAVRSRGVPGYTARGVAIGAILIGILVTATQWAGVTMMAIGWGAKP